ncbi:DUF680 domain-containing protein [Mesorhizobium sp. NPDC059054]|uniref:hypothetical protein n=1 Tax=unclassified Mesorhizobium TaxID=325217 RepID=UPI0006C73E8E|nr:hypothetical protein [Mesorhizobium sp. 1M-11]
MKTTALALAALVALSGTAFAGETVKTHAPATHAQTTVKGKLDYASTGSIKQDKNTNGPRLGVDVSPWTMPTIR